MIPPSGTSRRMDYQCIQSRLRLQPASPDARRCLRVLHRPGLASGPRWPPDGQKVTEQVAEMRLATRPHRPAEPGAPPRWSARTMSLKIQEMREANDYQLPNQLKLGAAALRRRAHGRQVRTGHHLLDGAEGGTGAGPHVAARSRHPPHGGHFRRARRASRTSACRRDRPRRRRRHPQRGDVAKALALGANAIAIGHSALMALTATRRSPRHRLRGTIGVPAGRCYTPHRPLSVGITTQDPELRKRLVVDEAAERGLQLPPHSDPRGARCSPGLRTRRTSTALEPETCAPSRWEAAAMAKVPLAAPPMCPARPRSGCSGR